MNTEATIKARFEIRTQNVRDNKHLNAIQAVLDQHGQHGTLQYVHKQNSDDIRGAAIYGTFPIPVVREINLLAIPASAKLGTFTTA